jgi:ankyrin repeat protein
MLALVNRHDRIARMLLSEGADVNATDSTGQCVLGMALENGQLEMAALLCNAGANIEATSPASMSLLQLAIMRGDITAALFLLQRGASVSTRTGDGRTTLQLAITHGVEEVVEELCKRGADVNAPDETGTTPLWMALRSKQEDIASVLVRHRCNLNLPETGHGGLTALHLAVRERDEFSACFLIKNGADVNLLAGEEPTTPLHMAAEIGLLPVVDTLLRHKANVNAIDARKCTPLHRAIAAAKQDAAAMLLKARPQLGLANDEDETPLDVCLRVKDFQTAQAIKAYSPAALEAANSRGLGYLHSAIARSDEDAVKFLIKLGINVNAPVQVKKKN